MKASSRPIVHWYVIAVLAIASALLLSSTWTLPSDEPAFWNAFTAFLVLAVMAEAGFLKIRLDSATSSVAFIPFLAAVLIFPPAWVMAIGGITEFVAETVIRRKPLIKVTHNTAKEIISVGAATHVYIALGGTPHLTLFAPIVPAFLAAVLVYFLVNQGATTTAITLSSRTPFQEIWRKLAGSSLAYDLVAGPVSILLVFLYVKLNLIGILVVIVPLFFVRHVYQMNMRLEQVNRDLLELMVKAIEARDPYTSGHSLRVSKLARAMAQDFGLTAKRVEEVTTAALLHDVGKIYEEFAPLLRKEGKLLPHEKKLMESHPGRSAELVRTISTLRGNVERAVRFHHESFNGTGYPDGLMGEDIPIGSRIIAIADTVDAMCTDRPYRKALPFDRVVDELQQFKGRQFDPQLVDLFCASSRIAMLVDTYSATYDLHQPKTVAETFDDLRRAFGQLPPSTAATRWRKSRSSASET